MMRKRANFKLFFMAVGTILLFQSCGDSALYDQVHSFEDKSWDKSDTAVFNLEVEDTVQRHDFILSLRTTRDYAYSDLWMYLHITAPDGTTSKVAQKMPLARPDGSWIGKVSGSLVESRLRFDSKPFPLKGEYEFKLVNATQEESIDEILDVGLRIE